MKNAGEPERVTAAGAGPVAQGCEHSEADRQQSPAGASGDGRTRRLVTRLLLERGPITAVDVAKELGVSPTAVRRHLDVLVAEGEAEVREARPARHRRRGRPAKLYLLTEAGRTRFGHAYDDLAVAALRYLAEHVGQDAVRSFAEHRMAALVDHHRESLGAGNTPAERAEVLADALTREGYAASIRRVGNGEQLCQHHCPVAHVAADFPQLCEAETAAFAEVLGTHVQRLATIANGDAVCTTHVPFAWSERSIEDDNSDADPTSAGPSTTDR